MLPSLVALDTGEGKKVGTAAGRCGSAAVLDRVLKRILSEEVYPLMLPGLVAILEHFSSSNLVLLKSIPLCVKNDLSEI